MIHMSGFYVFVPVGARVGAGRGPDGVALEKGAKYGREIPVSVADERDRSLTESSCVWLFSDQRDEIYR